METIFTSELGIFQESRNCEPKLIFFLGTLRKERYTN